MIENSLEDYATLLFFIERKEMEERMARNICEYSIKPCIGEAPKIDIEAVKEREREEIMKSFANSSLDPESKGLLMSLLYNKE